VSAPTAQPHSARETVLVVEDEPAMRRVLRVALGDRGYRVVQATTGRRAIAAVPERKPSLVLLDLGLPDVDGLEVIRRIRELSRIPIVVLTARSAETDTVEALDRGANDYVTKPFREAELFARIRACLRGFDWTEHGDWTVGDIHVESASRRVTVLGREVKLSATEYKLLSLLARAGGAVVTHQQFLREVWGAEYVKEVTCLRVYMHHLREKLEPDPACPRFLLTEAGIGYRLRA
jgi:two-component system KDP operon response regulator KdpE